MASTSPATPTFHDAFAANMKATGNLPAPRDLFETVTTATATILALDKAIAASPKDVLLRDLVAKLPTVLRNATIGGWRFV
jgi:hypothetical protein